MKNIILLLALYLNFLPSLNAQKKTVAVAGFLKFGYTSINGAANIINEIEPRAFEFNNNFLALGGESWLRINNTIVALDGNIGTQNRDLASINSLHAYFGTAYIKFGWIIKEKKSYFVYPSIATGIATLGISSYDRNNDEDDKLRDKFIKIPSLDFGLNADFLMHKFMYQEDYNAILSGLRIGYRISFKSSKWRTNGNEKLATIPSYSFNGFYVMLCFGDGAFVRSN